MKKYRANAASEVRVDYGVELCAGLQFFPETAGYAAPFQQLNDELFAAWSARRALRKPLIERRAAFRFAHYMTDQTIRMSHRAVEIADGGRKGGPLAKAIFPEGLGPVVAPYGKRQIKPTEDLIGRIERCKLPGIDAYRAEWQPKLQASLDGLKASSKDKDDAHDAYLGAFKVELGLRAEHYHSIDKIMGQVRATFPNDRGKQDLVFPEVDDDSEELGGAEDGADPDAGGEKKPS